MAGAFFARRSGSSRAIPQENHARVSRPFFRRRETALEIAPEFAERRAR